MYEPTMMVQLLHYLGEEPDGGRHIRPDEETNRLYTIGGIELDDGVITSNEGECGEGAHGAWSNLVIVGNRGTTRRDKRQDERTSVRGKRVSLLGLVERYAGAMSRARNKMQDDVTMKCERTNEVANGVVGG
jgi:hypothetical protein